MRWDSAPVARRIVRWVAAVRKGRADRNQIISLAKFIPGVSIGPALNVEHLVVPVPRTERGGPGALKET